jgi:hypothetical protein
MGKLTNLNPPAPIADADLPGSIARDDEIAAAVAAHLAVLDPHQQYLLPSEADERYRKIGVSQVFVNPAEKAICRSTGPINATGFLSGNTGLEVQADPATTSGSFMYFSRPGIYGVHIGLDSTNQFGLGGGNVANFFRFFHEGISLHCRVALPPASVGANSCGIGYNATGTAEICDYAGSGTGDAFNFYRVPGSPGGPISLANRIGRIDITGSYIQNSDRRLKSNFSPAPGLEAILKLKPLSYSHGTCDGFDKLNQSLKLGKYSVKKIGFVAQDVMPIIPEAVQVPSNNEMPWGIDYYCILSVAVRAIQEQQEQITDLQAQVQALSKA